MIKIRSRRLRGASPRQREASLCSAEQILAAQALTIVHTDTKGWIRCWSDNAEQMYGWKADEADGCRFTELLTDGKHEAWPELEERILAGHTWSGEVTLRRRDGSSFPALLTGTPIYEGRKIVGGAFAAQSLSSERQQVRRLATIMALNEMLRRTANLNELVETILEQLVRRMPALGAAIFLHSSGGSGEFETSSGAWQTPVVASEEYSRCVEEALETGKPAATSLIAGEADGDKPPCAFASAPLISQGHLIGALCMRRHTLFNDDDLQLFSAIADMTASAINRASLHEQTKRLYHELERRERLQKRILESIPSALLVIGPDLRVISANATFLKQFCGNQSCSDRLHTSSCDTFCEQIGLMTQVHEVFRTGNAAETRRYSHGSPGAAARIYDYRLVPLRSNGHVESVILVADDMTEQHNLEERLAHAARIESLGVMAGGIAHELRNPLSIISSSAQLLLSQEDKQPFQEECTRRIYKATRRADQIIGNLLQFARTASTQPLALDINHTLEEALGFLSHQLLSGQIELIKSFALDLPEIAGNRQLLQQVMINLCTNACQAMPNGGRLAVATHRDESGVIEVTVSDTGCGIAPEVLPRIFDPFFTTRPVGEGTGLGLSLSYKIIQQHRGTLDVTSQIGQGTTFRIRLPIALI